VEQPYTVWTAIRWQEDASSLAKQSTPTLRAAHQQVQHPPADVEAQGRSICVDSQRRGIVVHPQVSTDSPQRSALSPFFAQRFTKTPEVVRVQRGLLHEGDEGIAEASDAADIWTSAHVLLDYINLVTKKKTLKLRYENGEEEDVYEGVVDRPARRRLVRSKPSRNNDPTACRAMSLGEHGSRNESPHFLLMGTTPLQMSLAWAAAAATAGSSHQITQRMPGD
jgi:hypothetical protein